MTAPTPAQTQREHDADELVTEEMIAEAARAAFPGGWELSDKIRVHDALRAVAPMIAARAAENMAIDSDKFVLAGRELEREACAKIAWDKGGYSIGAAIRARGET
jgi:hypothetical protein